MVTLGDVLLTLLQLLAGGVVGYAVGMRQDRNHTLYQERSKSVIEIRNKLRAIRGGLHNDLLPVLESDSKGWLELDDLEHYFQALVDIGHHKDAIEGYKAAQMPWLDPLTQKRYQQVAGEVAHRLSLFELTLIRSIDPKLTARCAPTNGSEQPMIF